MIPDRSAGPADDRVVVIGAGHAGLCVVSALARRDVGCTVIDGAVRLGDVWRHRYDDLRLNTARDASRIPGATLPHDVGSWPTRDEWADHIESAARQLGVERRRERVERVERRPRGWAVVCADGEGRVGGGPVGEIAADAVVVATGRDRVPTIPPWPGLASSPIEVIHSSSYHRPSPFVGRRVLVVGAGNSGTEIAHLLASAGVEVTLSMRTRPVWARRELFGTDLTDLAIAGRAMPSWVVDASGRAMQPLLFGRMRAHGLGPPQRRLSQVHQASGATLDSGFVGDVKAGRIELVAAVERFDGAAVVLVDGSSSRPDVVIAATGTTPALGELLDDDLVDGGWPVCGEAPFEQAPGLFTAGLNPAELTAFHPDFIIEAEQIADAIVTRLDR
ncbi:flavin-containing monooxygenase [Ilumatobacter sp.]|uniref:flavin-containing monooxygenase n=1 Tax=Ilumatobacter sp. TaxID=1967498 RepID=UPI003B519E49